METQGLNVQINMFFLCSHFMSEHYQNAPVDLWRTLPVLEQQICIATAFGHTQLQIPEQ